MSLELALRTTVLLAVSACLAGAILRTAAARHAHWRLTTVAALALPALSLVSPAWSIRSLDDIGGEAGFPVWAGSVTSAASAATSPVTDRRAALRLLVAGAGMAWPVLWISGVVVTSTFFAAGYLHLWRLRRRSRPAPAEWTAAAARLAARAGLPAPPLVRVSGAVPGPLVCGARRPAVLIPPDACGWTPVRRDAVLVHELAHVRRGDVSAQLAAQTLAVLHWFNPLAWAILSRMRRDRELACDEAVLQAGIAPGVYAAELLAIATRPHAAVPSAALSMARASELEGRLLAMFERSPRRRQPVLQACLVVAMMAVCLVISGARVDGRTSDRAAVNTWQGGATTLLPVPLDHDASGLLTLEGADASAREQSVTTLALASGSQVVPALVAALDDPDAHVREKAAVGLAWRRDARVVPALLKAVADGDPHVREKALVALAFSGAPEARHAIEAARTDPDRHVRDKASTLLRLR